MTPIVGNQGRHARHQLDPLLSSPLRLSVLACLAGAERAAFTFVKDTVEITAPTLSKQVKILEEAGYLRSEKGYVGKRPRTWLSLTDAGRRAFGSHVAALEAIAAMPSARVRETPTGDEPVALSVDALGDAAGQGS
ncbi:MAG TPA: transcriptional regulator [Acidimicrobiales bacterium]|nr:transcriptional regulator [Acidimicrobiales bacterium]